MSKSLCDGERIFFEMNKECKVSCLKLVAWSIVAQKSTNVLIFYIFEYGAEYGAECSAEYGAKYYFINTKQWSCS